jgi:uncharacterized protein (DUF1501 family)
MQAQERLVQMPTQTGSVPRFIRTQSGQYVAVDKIGVIYVMERTESYSVHADLGSAWSETMGVYDTKADARAALADIMAQILNVEEDCVTAPARDFRRTAEAGE